MNNFPKNGFAYINDFIIKKEKPFLDSELVGVLEKGDTVHYEGYEQNEFGIWLILIEDDIKKYILAIDKDNNYFVNLPIISDGEYLIQPSEDNNIVLENDDKGIILNEININEKQKFNIQFIPEDNCYRIICISSNNSLELSKDGGNKLNQCEIFSENEIKWKIYTTNFKEYCLEDNKSKLIMEYSKENNNIILSEIKLEENSQKFLLISLDNENQNNENN